ncbi:aminohydrolase [Punctularia strigosozonata HHB-11173 SS5]|uniref:aminohydrolase n=1 Tax=Punctularia strigosozonata (strain HHB-11173) TaxID=741275 RepID=UPI0004416ABB|nr:aminohydrolase [Punctularia strigosozonata HHB-11173 SS5]EIN10308.1 aminohydrolase [Punctularia strigosozonata HHB-11173 SS5]
MSKYDTVVVNGVVVTAADIGAYAIAIKDGKVVALLAGISPDDLEGAVVIDAEGGLVTPGGVDAHVHIAQGQNTRPDSGSPGAVCADDFETGSRAAVAGGTTTMIPFAVQTRNDKSMLAVVNAYSKKAQASGSYIDYGFHVICTRADKEVMKDEMPVLVKDWGITSVKLFMTYEAMRLSDSQLLDVMLEAKKNRITTMIHAENGDLISWLTEKLTEKGYIEPFYHAQSRPPIVEGEATNRAVVLAELVQNPILFVHVSAASAAEVIRNAQTRGLPVYAETCPQYLHLTWQDLRRFHDPSCFENSKMICSPPPGPDGSDQEALWTGLHNGTFTIFSSDHCPFRYDDERGKMRGVLDHSESVAGEDVAHACAHGNLTQLAKGKTGHFAYIPNGCPGIETRVPLLFNYGVLKGRITPQKFVEVTATNPAKLYGLYPKKGALLPGLSDADLVIWYPEGRLPPFKLTNDRLHHNVDYTPFEGMEFTNWPRYTLLRGKVMWENGELVGTPRDGQFLRRGPSLFADRFSARGTDPRRVAAWLYD